MTQAGSADPTIAGPRSGNCAARAKSSQASPRRYADRADFANMPAGYFPGLATLHQTLLAPLGEPKSLQLVEHHKRGDDRWYRWRAAFKGKNLEITLSLAPDDKLTWFFVKSISE